MADQHFAIGHGCFVAGRCTAAAAAAPSLRLVALCTALVVGGDYKIAGDAAPVAVEAADVAGDDAADAADAAAVAAVAAVAA